MLKLIARYPLVQAAIASMLAGYLRLVRATTRFEFVPPHSYDRLKASGPFICAIWHGQNFMIPLALWEGARVSVLITRHGDGGVIAAACAALGITPIRASGGVAGKAEKKGGAAGLRAMVAALKGGSIVAMTPDAPKVARVAGPGIIALARLSRCPIYPIAVATGRRIDLKNWDRTSICLPFSRGVIVVGDPVTVTDDMDAEALDATRLALQDRLDDAHDRAYARLGISDPAAELKALRP